CLADLAAHAPDTPTPESCVHRAGAWSILLAVFPTPADQRLLKLRDCDRDCLSLLAMYDIPLPAEKIRNLLEGRGIGIYSLITVKRALARLKALRLIENSKRKQRGYFLLDTLPLFRCPPPTEPEPDQQRA